MKIAGCSTCYVGHKVLAQRVHIMCSCQVLIVVDILIELLGLPW